MARLRRRKDGGYYTAVRYGGNIATMQIHPEGVEYLYANDVLPGMEIPDDCRNDLWDEGWFYTKGEMEAGELEFAANELDEADDLDVTILEAVRDTSDRWVVLDALDENFDALSIRHADRPLFLFDPRFSVYYTVIHLAGRTHTDPVVMCIKFRAAQWLLSSGARIGRPLPEGTVATLFTNRWFYPMAGWAPAGASPQSLATKK